MRNYVAKTFTDDEIAKFTNTTIFRKGYFLPK